MLKIAVSGINAIDNPGPGTGIARSLKESGLDVKIIGLAYDSLEPGIYMDDIIDQVYIMPYPSGGVESFVNRLAYINSRENLDVIITALDAELPIFMDIESRLDQMGIKMLIPDKEMFNLRNKSNLSEIAEAIGVKVPAYYTCTSYTDVLQACNKVGFPCMIKGPFYEAFRVNNISETESFFHKIVNKWGFPVIIQKFIVGEEFDVIGCGDGTGNDLGIFAIRKMTTTKLGKVWNAISIQNKDLIETTRRVISSLKWRGGMEFEALVEDKTQDVYLLEINPRFPAWVYMSAACGVNLPERMVKFLMGMDHDTHSEYKSGKMMIRYTAEMIKDISDFEKLTSYGELDNKN